VSRVNFVRQDGMTCGIEIGSDVSVMLAAVRHGISGIEGECGGCLDCATCHVYVDDAQINALPSPDAEELELLGSVKAPRRPNSRLSCQLKSPFPIETLTVYIPEVQS
jgi:ferredoxin, 2Fe-2S